MSDPIMISFYAHKGGVGKTTALHNFASVLVKEFKLRVLLVDADPQCNLTSVVMKKNFSRLKLDRRDTNPTEELSGEEILYELRRKEREAKRVTLYECFETQNGTFNPLVRNLKQRIETIEPVEIEDYQGLLFIPGDLMVLKLEGPLSDAFSMAECKKFSDKATHPGVIGYVLRKVAERKEVDIILVDLNPNAGAFTRSFVLGSDYFILCNLPDFYSLQAVQSLRDVFIQWEEEMEPFRDENNFEGDKELMMPPPPKFLGSIFNQVKMPNGSPIIDHSKQVEKINEAISKNLVETEKIKIVVENFNNNNSILIREFDRTALKAIEKGIPMSYVTYDEIKEYNISEKDVDSARAYCFNAFCSAVLALFRNFSEQDHAKLKNLFKSDRATLQKIQRNAPDETKSEATLYKYGKTTLKGSIIDYTNTSASEALGCNQKDLGDCLTAYFTKPGALTIDIIKEIYDANNRKDFTIPNPEYKNLSEQFTKLYKNFESKKEKIFDHLIEMSEIDRLLKINSCHQGSQDEYEYLKAFFELKKTEIKLIKLISSEIISSYADKIKNGTIKAGIATLKVYSELNEVNMMILRKKNQTSNELELEFQKNDGKGEMITLLYQDWNNFNKLVRGTQNRNKVSPRDRNIFREPPHQRGEESRKKVKRT